MLGLESLSWELPGYPLSCALAEHETTFPTCKQQLCCLRRLSCAVRVREQRGELTGHCCAHLQPLGVIAAACSRASARLLVVTAKPRQKWFPDEHDSCNLSLNLSNSHAVN